MSCHIDSGIVYNPINKADTGWAMRLAHVFEKALRMDGRTDGPGVGRMEGHALMKRCVGVHKISVKRILSL